MDVYGFGVVLLELLTGKDPLDSSFPDGTTIVTWVTSYSSEEKILSEVLCKQLLDFGNCLVVREMILVLKIAIFCVNQLPKERPTMREVVSMLKQAKEPREKSLTEKVHAEEKGASSSQEAIEIETSDETINY